MSGPNIRPLPLYYLIYLYTTEKSDKHNTTVPGRKKGGWGTSRQTLALNRHHGGPARSGYQITCCLQHLFAGSNAPDMTPGEPVPRPILVVSCAHEYFPPTKVFRSTAEQDVRFKSGQTPLPRRWKSIRAPATHGTRVSRMRDYVPSIEQDQRSTFLADHSSSQTIRHNAGCTRSASTRVVPSSKTGEGSFSGVASAIVSCRLRLSTPSSPSPPLPLPSPPLKNATNV